MGLDIAKVHRPARHEGIIFADHPLQGDALPIDAKLLYSLIVCLGYTAITGLGCVRF